MTPTPMAAARRPDWPERLADFLESRRRMPFEWGSNDCCLFAADAVLAQTGFDMAAHVRGQYASAIEAARLLEEEGGVIALATTILGEPLENPALQQRGDVVCVPLQGRDTLGINAGNGHWCAPGEAGLVFRPIDEAVLVWRV